MLSRCSRVNHGVNHFIIYSYAFAVKPSVAAGSPTRATPSDAAAQEAHAGVFARLFQSLRGMSYVAEGALSVREPGRWGRIDDRDRCRLVV